MASQTLREIAIEHAKKRPELVDYLTKKAPILDAMKWVPATHGLWNVEEVLSQVNGAGMVDLDAPLPSMDASTRLETTYVSVMGGRLEVGVDKAAQFGGPDAYFSRREEKFFNMAGMDTEKGIFTNYWRKAAIKAGCKQPAGGSGSALSTIMVVKMDSHINTGIFDPAGFKQGRLLEVSPLYGGNKYLDSKGRTVYGVEYRGRFGWQILAPKECVFALTNIDAEHLPTLPMIEDAIAAVEGDASDTMIFGYAPILQKTFSAIKQADIMYVNGDKSIQTIVGDINGVKLIGSYNVSKLNEAAVA